MGSLFSLDRFDRPQYLWLLLLAVLMAWMARRSIAGLGPVRAAVSLITRAFLVLLLVLALAGTHKIEKIDDLNVMFLLDVSRSIPPDKRRESEEFIRRAGSEMRPNDRLAILTFDGQTNIEQLPSRPAAEGGVHIPSPFADGSRPDRTNLAQALRMAAACALENAVNRVVLISDGNQNVGEVIEEVKAARASGMTIDVLPTRYEAGAEVVFEELRAPAYAHLNEQVSMRMILRSDRNTTGTIVVYQQVGQNEEQVILDRATPNGGQRVTLAPGSNAFLVPLPIRSARSHQFRAEFIPDDKNADAVSHNNVARAFTHVEGPSTVLVLGTERDRAEDAFLLEALRKENIDVEWAVADAVNLDPTVLSDYSAVVLANTPADLFGNQQQQFLATYVRDGGGLVMIGGDDSFGAGGWQGSVVEDIMPVKFDVDAVKQIPRGALAIVMHSCEMPQGNAWGVQVAVASLKTLSKLDYFGIVSAGMGPMGHFWEVPMGVVGDKDAIVAKVNRMQNADMFDFDPPMRMAYNALMSQCKDAAQRHMIIISDGDPQAPSAGLLNMMVGNKITCSTVSIFPHGGQEITTMRNIAKRTGGNYYDISKPGDEKKLPKIFVKESKVVRRPLIREEPFTPKVRPSLSDIMAGIAPKMPQLKGYVVTTPREGLDVDFQMPLVTDKGDPLLAHWQVGFGKSVAFTSGRWQHWGSEWPEWPSFSKLWAQSVRWCMRQGTAADYDYVISRDGDQGHIVIETLGEKQSFANFRQFKGRVTAPDGESKDLQLTQTGPGRYEAKFDAREQGTYLVSVGAPGEKSEKPVLIRSGLTVAYSPEFKDLSANEPLLRTVAEQGDGRVLSWTDDSKTVFAHNLPPVRARKPVWDWLLKWAIVVFLIDVAVRRIAFDPVKAFAYAKGYIASLAGRRDAKAEQTLADLKGVRAKVRTERTKEGDAAAIAAAKEAKAAALDRGAKFDATQAGARIPSRTGGIASQLDEQKPSAGPSPKPTDKKDDKPAESTTARLLKARKRVQDQRDDENK